MVTSFLIVIPRMQIQQREKFDNILIVIHELKSTLECVEYERNHGLYSKIKDSFNNYSLLQVHFFSSTAFIRFV